MVERREEIGGVSFHDVERHRCLLHEARDAPLTDIDAVAPIAVGVAVPGEGRIEKLVDHLEEQLVYDPLFPREDVQRSWPVDVNAKRADDTFAEMELSARQFAVKGFEV